MTKKIPDDKFENDLDFDVEKSNARYSPDFEKKKQEMIERLKPKEAPKDDS